MEIKVSAELATYGVPQYATPGLQRWTSGLSGAGLR